MPSSSAHADDRAGRETRTFGSLLRAYRLERKLSQQQLADRAGVSVEAVSALERGTRLAPQRGTIARLSAALALEPSAEADLCASAERRMPLPPQAPAPAGGVRSMRLPTWATPLIGREADLEELERRLERYRMVSIVAMGGAGKTRIASELAGRRASDAWEIVRFVELAALRTGSPIAATVARTVCERATVGDPTDACVAAIDTRRMLLVLDNCEHIIDDAGEFASRLLSRCPNLRILSTSRQPLEISGESVFRLPHLSVPTRDLATTMTLSSAYAFPGVALFVDRAREAGTTFLPAATNVEAIVDICCRLDGLPLAIELAAVRARSLSFEEIAKRLDHVSLLSLGGKRVERHRTLRALVDWSYDLLDHRERAFLTQLAVFSGGFTLEAARAIDPLVRSDESATLDALDSLVAKSFIVRTISRTGRSRFTLLETIRAYLLDRLERSGGGTTARDRHLAYFAGESLRAREAFRVRGVTDMLKALRDDRDNLAAAIAHAVATGDGARGIDVLASTHWFPRDLQSEDVVRWADALDAMGPLDNVRRARLWNAVAQAKQFRLDWSAAETFARAASYAQGCDPDELASAYAGAVLAHLRRRDFEVARAYVRELEAMEVSALGALDVLSARAQLATYSGERELAIELFTELRMRHLDRGDTDAAVRDTANVAEAEFALGLHARAVATYEQVAHDCARAGVPILAFHLSNAAAYYSAVETLDRAYACAFTMLASRAGGEQDIFTLQHIALALALEGDLESAALLEGYATETIRARSIVGDYTERYSRDRLSEILERELPVHARAGAGRRGSAFSFDEAVSLAKSAHAGVREKAIASRLASRCER
jgi:predicted ATPase/DNA-binding XRE family transcriptional regulator